MSAMREWREGCPPSFSTEERVEVRVNRAAVIKEMEDRCSKAATNPEFEKASRLRDEVKGLREIELDTLSGEVRLLSSGLAP